MRGGKQVKNRELTSQQALLDMIWKHFGGPTKVAKMLGKHRQVCISWKNRGKVPLIECTEVAEKLIIPTWGLNYEELIRFHSPIGRLQVPAWKDVVKSYEFTPSVTKYILSLPHPKE